MKQIIQLLWIAGIVFSLSVGRAEAQFDLDFKVVDELQQFNRGPGDPNLKITSAIRMQPGSRIGVLEITANMNRSWHVYSLTQPAGGPMKSVIKLDDTNQFRLLGSFAPDHPPKLHFLDVFRMNGEEFSKVTWSAPIEVLGSIDNLKITGFVEGQVCADGGACIPFDRDKGSFAATVNGQLTPAETKTLEGVDVDGAHARIRSWLSTDSAKPGDTVQMYVAFNPQPKWHVYAWAEKPPSPFQKPTLIHAALPSGWKTGPVTSASPIVSEEGLPNDPPIRYYAGSATITVPIQIPATAKPGVQPLSGHVAFQTCSTTCDPPTAVTWTSQLKILDDATTKTGSLGAVSFGSKPVAYNAVIKALAANAPATATSPVVAATEPSSPVEPPQKYAGNALEAPDKSTDPAPFLMDSVVDSQPDSQVDSAVALNVPDEQVAATNPGASAVGPISSVNDIAFEEGEETNSSLLGILGAAFVGGFVLNFMPCVLPVIGLKVLSFVDQAGSDRVKVFNLNLVYSLGMLTIFWILAALAAAPAMGLAKEEFGWGAQFAYQGFAIPVVAVVFVMALSFLGVWEIPIPGFAAGSKATDLAAKEGYSGAFFKGVITTLLATPCAAPGLAAAYAFAVGSGSAFLPFLIFTVLGLGMALPYLLIGAFPSLVSFLPKPGPWMESFKQLMGFVLLGTVIFLLQNVTFPNLVPTIGLLFGLWFACWWIGSVPMTAEPEKRMRAWAIAAVIALLATVVSFGRSFDAFGRNFGSLRSASQQKYNFGIDRILSERGEALAAGVDVEDKPEAHSANALPWETFSPRLLDELVRDGNTVLVDFTADW